MKRYLIRCMGTILCVITRCMVGPSGEAMAEGYADRTYTLGNDMYKIRYYTGAAWYVGWLNLNLPGPSSSQQTTRNKLFSTSTLTYKDQPLVPYYHYSGYTGTAISARSFGYGNANGGTAYSMETISGRNQYFLRENPWVTDMKLVYAPTSSPFRNAGCCYYSKPIKAGNARSFSYSGNGEAGSTCPCFYTEADIVYTGSKCNYYEGKPYSYCTGVGVIKDGAGASNIGTGDGTSSYWPAAVHNVYYCYEYAGCASSSQYIPFNPSSAVLPVGSNCHMARMPLVGLVDATTTTDLATTSDNVFNPVLSRAMRCGSGTVDTSCAFSGLSYYLHNAEVGCTSCPTVGSTISGPGGTSYSITGGGGYGTRSSEYGVASCYVQNPAGADSAGYYTLLTSAGSTLTCDYGS